MPETFAQDLARALAATYGVTVPVVVAPLDTACIVAPPPWSGGCPYSGYISSQHVELLHFVRPDGTAMTLDLWWEVHELSGQLDVWNLTATGFSGTGLEPLLAARPAPHLGNHARISVSIT